MIVKYWVNCFDRELCVKFPLINKEEEVVISDRLDEAYNLWHSTEEIADDEYRAYVEDSCCEEFMIDYMEQVYDGWTEWWVEGDEDEDGNEIPVYITRNEKANIDYSKQTYITLDAEELMLLGIEEEYWDDCEVINDCIRAMIYERRKQNENK